MSEVSIRPYHFIKEYTDFSDDINLVTDSPDGAAPARAIFVVDAGGGLLSVETGKGVDSAFTAVAVGLFEPSPTWYNKILAASDVAKVRVAW